MVRSDGVTIKFEDCSPSLEWSPTDSLHVGGSYKLTFTLKINGLAGHCCEQLSTQKEREDQNLALVHCKSGSQDAGTWLRNGCGIVHLRDLGLSLIVAFSGRIVLLPVSAPQRSLASLSSMTDGKWHRVALHATDRTVALTIDGELVGRLVLQPGGGRTETHSAQTWATSPWLRIGTNHLRKHDSFRGWITNMTLGVTSTSDGSGTPSISSGSSTAARWTPSNAAEARDILARIAQTNSDCVPPRTIAATFLNKWMVPLYAVRARALPRCFHERTAVLCSGDGVRDALSRGETCVPWMATAPSDMRQHDFLALTWARWQLMHFALTSVGASVGAVLWLDADLVLLRLPWAHLGPTRPPAHASQANDCGRRSVDLAHGVEFFLGDDHKHVPCAWSQQAGEDEIFALGSTSANINTGVLLLRNASLAEAVLQRDRRSGLWEQTVANDVLRPPVPWRVHPLPSDDFGSFCHGQVRVALGLQYSRGTPSLADLANMSDPSPSDVARACAPLRPFICGVVAVHAACASNNVTSAKFLTAVRNHRKAGSRSVEPLTKLDVMERTIHMHALCAGAACSEVKG